MNTVTIPAAMLFSPGQLAAILLVCVLLAGLLALNGFLLYRFHRRGERKLYTKQLQLQREALMQRLARINVGGLAEASFSSGEVAAQADEEEEDEPDEDEETEAEELADEESDTESVSVELDESGRAVRYNRSFTARITQADNDLKARYSELKNYLLSFGGIRSRMSWKRETFSLGRKSLAGFTVRGKTLCLCLATDPALFDGTKFKVDDLTSRTQKNTLPCRYRLTSDRKTGYAKELIHIVLAGFGVERQRDYKAADYTLPYRSTKVLVERRLIKVVGDTVPDYEKEAALAAAKGIQYNRSFAARVIQSDDALKARYSKLKNHILSYDGVHEADSWKRETFRRGKSTVAGFLIRGKTLCLCLAADPALFDGTKFKVEDVSGRSKNNNLPLMYRVKSDRRVAYAVKLIDTVFARQDLQRVERTPVDYAVPYKSTDTLVRRGLIRESQGTAYRPQPKGPEAPSAPKGE